MLCIVVFGGWFVAHMQKRITDAGDVRFDAMNRLKYVGLAIASYNAELGALPRAATYDGQGKPLLSWRVALLPYLEKQPLYDEFKLNEPWDSPHKLKLLPRMPWDYQQGRKPEKNSEGMTYLQLFHGRGATFDDQDLPLSLAKLTKDPARTILVVEGAEAVPWTKPADLAYDDDQPLPKLGTLWQSGFLCLFADGHVQTIPRDVQETQLRLAITRKGKQADEFP